MNANVAVLRAAGVALAGGIGRDGVEGAEMATHTTDLVLKDFVVEAGFKLTLTGGGAGDVHGGLSTAEYDKVLVGSDGGAVEGCIAGIGFENFEIASRKELEGGLATEKLFPLASSVVAGIAEDQMRGGLAFAVLSLHAVIK